MRKCSWVAVLACACAATATLSAAAPPGYISARELAQRLTLEHRVLDFVKSGTGVSACRLSNDEHQVTLHAGLTRAFVDQQMVSLSGAIRQGDADLFVPKDTLAKVSRILTPHAPAPALPRTRVRKVVIDPGHGGKDPGAISPWGLREKDVNLAVSKRLAALLRGHGVKVVMTRTTDIYPTLDERIRLANLESPDVFISIHTNSVRNNGRVSGFLTLYPQDGAAGSRGNRSVTGRALAAARANQLDPGAVGAGTSLTRDAEKALCGALLEEYRVQSLELAKSIQQGLGQKAATRNLGAREDERGLRVLRWVFAPAVLVEVDFLSNRRADRRLRAPGFRQKLAEGIADGILGFLKALDRTDGFTN